MHVTLCVDALEPQLGGIGRYTWELCKGLPHQPDIEELRFFARNSLLHDPSVLLSRGYKHKRAPWPFRAMKRRRVERILRSDIVHGPNYFLPSGVERGVITVHDLSVFLYPETHPAARVKAFERQFTHSLQRAAYIITDTETARRELIDVFAVPEHQVTAVHLGVDSAFQPQTSDQLRGSLANYGLPVGGYALCVSTLEPRKKISELLAAWRMLPSSVRDSFPLVLAGGTGWRNEALHEAIRQGTAEGWLRHLGFVEDADLPKLYAGAALFLYPSIYEGFGLPPLEAMASGVPVVVSGKSCLPEVGGDAAIYIDPDDSDGFVAGIQMGLLDENWRSSAIARGLDRSREFSWQRCIEATKDVYRKVI